MQALGDVVMDGRDFAKFGLQSHNLQLWDFWEFAAFSALVDGNILKTFY